VTDAAGTTVLSYDEAGRTTKVAQQIENGPYGWALTQYAYDRNGNLSGLIYPSARALELDYDAADRPVTATFDGEPVVTGITYAPFGPRVGFT